MNMQQIEPDRLYTYQELAAPAGPFNACAKTVAQWFRDRKGKFRPTKRTVRIPGSEVLAFIREKMSPELDAGPDTVRGTKRPVERA